MVFCWKNAQVRRWIGDCTPWRRKERACDGLGIQGADLENARVLTPNPPRDLRPSIHRPSIHKPTFSELALEKEIQCEDTTRFSIFSRHTTVPDMAASFGARSIQPSLSLAGRALRYVTKDTQQFLFPELKSEKVTPVASPPSPPSPPSPRKFSFRSSRAMKKGGAGTKLTISAPIYGEFPTLTLALPPVTVSWPDGSTRTITGSGSSEPSPALTIPLTDCAETLSSFASEEISTIDYYHNDAFTRRHFDDFDNRRKRLSCSSQYSGISIMSTDTGRISLAQVAMRPESRPTLQIIGPCESPRRVVVVHY
ncbi:hypothetical protein Q9L58_006738 [Maublancomyces gigas]|uniref:Uncharacterized protein n=1 Tax=Discina gigas TaxID=1032678 RepID=A0ABR3GEI8_9PEZI